MTKHTANYNLPYPEGSDQVAVHADVESLAVKTDAEMSQITAKVEETVSTELSWVARKKTGKNLLNPEHIVDQTYLNDDGSLREISSMETSGYIPVKAGQYYTSNMTAGFAFYDRDRNYLAGTWEQVFGNPSPPHTMLAPADGFLRVYRRKSGDSRWQVEVGERVTSLRPYRVELERVVIPSEYIESSDDTDLTAGQSFTRSHGDLTATTSLDGKTLEIRAQLSGGGGVFDWGHILLDGKIISTSTDDVAPVVTQQGTIGANHGFNNAAVWPAGTHNKTSDDLGSLWTDGTNEYAIVQIRDNGAMVATRKYITYDDGSHHAPRSLPSQLYHVSGATNISDIAAPTGLGQLLPARQRLIQRVTVDGREFLEGSVNGTEMRIQESYDILDFASLYDTMTANVGVPYEELSIAPAMRLESDWRIRPHGKISGEFHLTELQPTQLNRWSGLHAGYSSAAHTRWLPGVKPINGLDWSAGVPTTRLSEESQMVTVDDLHNPSQPPTVLIDVASDFAVAVGIDPWYEDGHGAQRINDVPNALWYLPFKIYPRVAGNRAPGWGRVSIRGIRQYLTVEETHNALSYPTDTLMAWATLDTLH